LNATDKEGERVLSYIIKNKQINSLYSLDKFQIQLFEDRKEAYNKPKEAEVSKLP